MMHRILIVEDDKTLRLSLTASLKAEGYAPDASGSVNSARDHIAAARPDLIVLDLGLPDADGMTLLTELRASGDLTPIIVLTARGDEDSKVRALDHGADDYVTKPFGLAELLARIRSALRHSAQSRLGTPIVTVGDLTIDFARRRAERAGRTIQLTRKEFDLLAELAAQAGTPVPHETLLNAVWGAPDADIRYLRVYIGQLREKLGDDPAAPTLIFSEPSFGYRLGGA